MPLFAQFLARWTTAIVRCRHVARHHHSPEDKTQEHTALHFTKLHFLCTTLYCIALDKTTLYEIYFALDWKVVGKASLPQAEAEKYHRLCPHRWIFHICIVSKAKLIHDETFLQYLELFICVLRVVAPEEA